MEWDELRHTAAVIGTVLGARDQPHYSTATASAVRNRLAGKEAGESAVGGHFQTACRSRKERPEFPKAAVSLCQLFADGFTDSAN